MPLTKEITSDELYILKQVFSKVEYDSTIEKYIIRLDAYLPLKLTKAQRVLLEKICRYYDIALEKLPKHLTQKEALPLFIEYDKLKKELASNSNSEKLRNRMIEVRNQLVEGYLETMYIMISKYLKNIDNKYVVEDIYQDCYEVLIGLIEEYNPYAGIRFVDHMSHWGYRKLWGKINISKDTLNTNNNLNKLLVAKRRHQQKFGTDPTIDDLIITTGMYSKQIESSLQLEQTLEQVISFEELYDSTFEIQGEKSSRYEKSITPTLIDDSLEDRASAVWLREILLKIIDTLPRTEKEMTLMRYGFATGIPLTPEEIRKELNISNRQTVGDACQKAIEKLKSPYNLKYLEQVVREYTNAVYPDMEKVHRQSEKNSQCPRQIKQARRNREIYLLSKLNKEDLARVIEETIPKKNYRAFLNLLFGLNGEPQCPRQTIIERLQIDKYTYIRLRREALEKLISILEERCSQSSKPLSEEELIDYLMTNYLNHPMKRILRK